MTELELLKTAIIAALGGGEEILRVYHTDFDIETKSDNTPVTIADKGSSKRILKELSSTGLPSISEEEVIVDYEIRKLWPYFWLIDPLDGTKEFIKKNGEFAVNIALIKGDTPVIGVIYAPAIKELYFSTSGHGSYKLSDAEAFISNTEAWFEKLLPASKRLPLHQPPKKYTVVASRSYLSREVNERVQSLKSLYGQVDMINVGSSIKQCWVAEGKAHEYPRFGTTMEWDTAAGQCILKGSGKDLVDFETLRPLKYNKRDMENSFFIAR